MSSGLNRAGISKHAQELRRLWSGFQGSRVLFTANNYRIFDHLKKQKTAASLAKDLGTDKRATEILLDALTGLGLLNKQKKLYKNTATASELLVSEKPFYQGDIIRHASTLWDNWSGLDKTLKTGNPCQMSQNHEAFILAMHNLSVFKAKEVVRAIGLRDARKALDLGGGPGTYAMEIAKKGIHVVLFDRPETIRIARRVINKTVPALKARSRKWVKGIDFIRGDFIIDDIGNGYDIILISQIFHAYPEKDNIGLLKKCRNALNTNGRVVVQEFLIDEGRTRPAQSALFAVNMLVNTSGGRCYSQGEISEWCLKAGFKRTRKRFINDNILITAEM